MNENTLRAVRLDQVRILLADDQEFVRTTLRTVLKGFGCQHLQLAKDGQTAIKHLSQFQPDLLITDLQMRPVNGLDLIRRVRSGMTRAPRALPALALTGHAERHIVGTALLLDVSGFIVKPVKPVELYEKIQRALQHPVEIGDASSYQRLSTDIDALLQGYVTNDAEPQQPARRREEATLTAATRTAPAGREIRTRALEPGMRLAEDLCGRDGTTLVRAGVEMSEQLVLRIKDVSRILDIKTVRIEASSLSGSGA